MGIEAAIAAALTTYIGATAAAVAASVITGLARAIVFAGISRALSKKPGGQRDVASGTPVSTRQPAAPWQVVYGEARVGGTYAFLHTGAADNAFLHIVIAIADHEIHAIDKVFFDAEELVFDGAGNCTGAIKPDGVQWVHYAAHVFMVKRLGVAGQSAIPELIAAQPAFWTSQHRGEGHAYVYLRLKYDQGVFPNGVPGITFQIRGRNRIYDPRTGTSGYSANAALCLADYLTNSTFGLGVDYDEEIDETELIAAANICDEAVSLAAGGTQPRYECNGAFTTDRTPREIIGDLLTALGGSAAKAHPIGGKWKIFPGAFRTPTLTLDESDLRGPIGVQPRLSRRDAFNGVKGLYLAENNRFQPADFPAVQVAAYVAEDGGEEIWKDIQLPFTNNGAAAQRIARLELERGRRQLSASLPCKFSAWRLQAGDAFMLDNTRFGWSAKVFEVVETRLAVEADGTIGVDLSVREIDSGAYAWSASEQATNAAPVTNLPDPFTVAAPTLLLLASGTAQLYVRGDGTVASRLRADWTAPPDAFVARYELEFKPSAAATWLPGGSVRDAVFAYLTDVQDGVSYDVRVRSVSTLGVRSDWLTKTGHTVIGKIERPADVPTLYREGDLIRWPYPSPPLDMDGFLVRHHAGVNRFWPNAQAAHDGVVTLAQFDIAALGAGLRTIMVKAVDTSGNESLNAAVLIANLGDPIVANLIETIDHRDLVWPGEATNASVVSGDLAADDTGLLFWSGSGVNPFWAANSNAAFWADTYLALTYLARFTPAASVLPCQLTLGVEIAAESWTVEYRRDPDVLFWTDDAAPFWTGAADAFWEPLGDFIAWPGALELSERFELQFRVSAAASRIRGVLAEFQVRQDVPDVVERLDDVALASGGTRLPIAKSYRVIRNVLLTLQDDGGTAETIRVLDKSASGPLVRAFNSAGTGVAASVDATIQGY